MRLRPKSVPHCLLTALVFLVSGAVPLFAQNPLPITGNLGALTGQPSPYSSYVVTLQNCAAPVTIPGLSVIVQQQAKFVADSAGNINGTVWSNDQIDCNGTTGNSQYSAQVISDDIPVGGPSCYQVIHTQGSWNINIQQPVACGTSPPNPQDATFNNLVVLNTAIVPTPTLGNEAATKAYVDASAGGGIINPKTMGVVGDGNEVVDAVTNGTATVTSATANFVPADIGKILAIYPQTSAGFTSNYTGTIVAPYVNSTTINVSPPVTFTATGAVMDYGTDDSTAFQNVWTAASCTKGFIQDPPGIYMLGHPLKAACSLNMGGSSSSNWIPYNKASGVTFVSTVTQSATLSAYSAASGTVTLTAANNFTAGQAVAFSVTAGPTCLNALAYVVSATGLSTSQFQVAPPAQLVSCPNGSGAATGTASAFAFQIGSPTTFYAGLNLHDFALKGNLAGKNAIFLNNVGAEGYINRVNLSLWNGDELYCDYCQDIMFDGLALTIGGNRPGSYALSLQQVSNLLHFNNTLIAACPGCIYMNSVLGAEFNGGHFENDDGGSNSGTLFDTNYTSSPYVIDNSTGVSFSGLKWYSNQVEQMMITNGWSDPAQVPYTITAFGDTALGFTDNDFDNASGLGGSIWMNTFTGTGSPLLSSTIVSNRFTNADIQVPMLKQQMGVFAGNTVSCYDNGTTPNYYVGLFTGVTVDQNHISCLNGTSANKTTGYVFQSVTNVTGVPTVLGGGNTYFIQKYHLLNDTTSWVGPTYPLTATASAFIATGPAVSYTTPNTSVVDNSAGAWRALAVGADASHAGSFQVNLRSTDGSINQNAMICAPNCVAGFGLGIGAGHVFTRHVTLTASLTPTAVTANACAVQSLTVTGAQVGDFVTAIIPPSALSHVSISGAPIAGAGTIAVNFCGDGTGGTPPAGTWTFDLEQ